MYDCKHTEVSAAIDHQIDELFIGIVKQIRLLGLAKPRLARVGPSGGCGDEGGAVEAEGGEWALGPWARRRQSSDSCCLSGARDSVVARLLRGQRRASKSCANLYVL